MTTNTVQFPGVILDPNQAVIRITDSDGVLNSKNYHLLHFSSCDCIHVHCWVCANVYIFIFAVVIGFNQIDYTIDENTGTVQLSVSVQDGNIPEAETRIVTLTTSDGTAQCMIVLIIHTLFSSVGRKFLDKLG